MRNKKATILGDAMGAVAKGLNISLGEVTEELIRSMSDTKLLSIPGVKESRLRILRDWSEQSNFREKERDNGFILRENTWLRNEVERLKGIIRAAEHLEAEQKAKDAAEVDALFAEIGTLQSRLATKDGAILKLIDVIHKIS